MAPPGAGAGAAAEQTEHVARDALHRNPAPPLPLRIGQHGGDRLVATRRRRAVAENLAVGGGQHIRVLIGRAADHHAVHMFEMAARLVQTGDAAIDDHFQRRPVALETVDALVVQRRDLAVLLRRQA